MKNKLSDLNDHLFAQLERLSEESLKGEKLTEEIRRAKSVADVAREIVSNGRLALDAQEMVREWCLKPGDLPEMLSLNGKKLL